jgi:hypothetical protein
VSEAPHAEGLTITPEPARWDALLHGRRADQRARRFREQLGLPVDRLLIMTGHQAGFWHPGILAKYLAADAAARKPGAGAAWIVVDQDSNDPALIRYPVRRGDGGLGGALWDVEGDAPGHEPDTSTGSRAAIGPARPPTLPPDQAPAADSVLAGMAHIYTALESRSGEASLARQFAGAAADLLRPLVPPAPTVYATALAGTELFGELVDVMERDPGGCVRAYNAAVRARPEGGVRTLVFDDINERYELPLWWVQAGEARRRVYAEDLPGIPRSQLAPRALFMTALLRLAGCDLFIHGTGGGAYDLITAEWLGEWAPTREAALAPMAVVTATRRLPLEHEPIPSAAEAARAAWAARHALHTPAMLGDQGAQREKDAMVERIRTPRRSGVDRAAEYRRMHALLERVLVGGVDRLRALREEARRARARLGDEVVLAERTWAFPLYPPAVLAAMRDEVEAAFGVRRGRS